jgi:hypothetical protein
MGSKAQHGEAVARRWAKAVRERDIQRAVERVVTSARDPTELTAGGAPADVYREGCRRGLGVIAGDI